MREQSVLTVSVLLQMDLADFDSTMAVIKKQLFRDSVPKQQYIKLQQVRSLEQCAKALPLRCCDAWSTRWRCHGVCRRMSGLLQSVRRPRNLLQSVWPF